jgi:hypothetical protein
MQRCWTEEAHERPAFSQIVVELEDLLSTPDEEGDSSSRSSSSGGGEQAL